MTGKAYMAYDECWYCMPCEADCPTGAVTVNIPYLVEVAMSSPFESYDDLEDRGRASSGRRSPASAVSR